MKINTLFAALLLCTMLTAMPAYADKKGHGNPHDKSQHSSGNNDGERYSIPLNVSIRIGDRDRIIINEYLQTNHKKSCPPGLAKKNNGCLPPGIAKKYRVGGRLPDGVNYRNLPADLLRRLGHPPVGYQYIQVDKDVLLMAEATKKIVDAITLISAVGR